MYEKVFEYYFPLKLSPQLDYLGILSIIDDCLESLKESYPFVLYGIFF